MLTQSIIEDLKALKLTGAQTALQTIIDSHALATTSLTDGLGVMLSQELRYRETKRQQRLLKQAKLRISNACMEGVDYQHSRGLQAEQMRSLVQGHWLEQARNIVFVGATGLGKSYLACALGQWACRQGISTRYYRLSKLLECLRTSYADGSLTRQFLQLAKQRVLILDDWGLTPLDEQQRQQLLEIIEDRHLLHPTIITTQLPIEHWHDWIGDNTVADAIVDRLIAKAEVFQLQGQSMRRLTKKEDSEHVSK